MVERQHERKHRHQHRMRGFEIFVEQEYKDRYRHAEGKSSEYDSPGPSELSIDGGKQHLRQPGVRNPGFACVHQRKKIRVGDSPMIDDPLSYLDLPEAV